MRENRRKQRVDSPLRYRVKSDLKTAKSRRKIRNILEKSTHTNQQVDAFDSKEFKEKYGEISDEETDGTEMEDEPKNKQLNKLLNAQKDSKNTDEEPSEIPSYAKNTDISAYDNYVIRYSRLRTGSTRGRRKNNKSGTQNDSRESGSISESEDDKIDAKREKELLAEEHIKIGKKKVEER